MVKINMYIIVFFCKVQHASTQYLTIYQLGQVLDERQDHIIKYQYAEL